MFKYWANGDCVRYLQRPKTDNVVLQTINKCGIYSRLTVLLCYENYARWRLSGPIFETDLSTVWGIQGSYVITVNTHSPSFKELSHTKWDPWVRLFFLSDRVALCIEGAVFPWWRQGATGTYPGSGSALWGDFSGQAGEITLIGCVGYCSPLKLKDFFCGDFI